MTDIKEIYHFPIDGEGNEVEEPIRVGLNEDGSADLSGLPEEMRKTFESSGVSTPITRHKPTMPKNGKEFFRVLLQEAGPYQRFRSKADKAN